MIDRYDFYKHLRESASHANDPFWGEVYRKAFPGFYHRIVVTDRTLQHQGVDSVVQLKGGGKIYVDEKVREVKDKRGRTMTPETHGILLEEWSSVREGKVGWWRADLQTQFIAYAFLATQQCLMIPFQALRRTRVEFGNEWLTLASQNKQGFREVRSASRRGADEWETYSIVVPVNRLKAALSDVIDISWGERMEERPAVCQECGITLSADSPGPLCRWHTKRNQDLQNVPVSEARIWYCWQCPLKATIVPGNGDLCAAHQPGTQPSQRIEMAAPLEPCLGGCGVLIHSGRHCFDCASTVAQGASRVRARRPS